MFYNLFFGLFAGVVVYFYCVDNLGVAHDVSIAVALIAGMLVSFVFHVYSMEYDRGQSELERFERKWTGRDE